MLNTKSERFAPSIRLIEKQSRNLAKSHSLLIFIATISATTHLNFENGFATLIFARSQSGRGHGSLHKVLHAGA